MKENKMVSGEYQKEVEAKSARRAYSSPSLVIYGSAVLLTASGSVAGNEPTQGCDSSNDTPDPNCQKRP